MANSQKKAGSKKSLEELKVQNTDSLNFDEATYKAIFENSMDAILLTVPDGRVLSANPAACEMFGRKESEIRVIGQNGLVDINDQRLQKLVSERERTGKARGNVTFLRNKGSSFEGEISSSVFTDINGEIRKIIIIRDLSNVKRLEDLHLSTIELLKILNKTLNKTDLLRGITEFIKERFDFDTVAIRLGEGNDFPGYQSGRKTWSATDSFGSGVSFPVKIGKKTFGSLQIRDKRKDRFSPLLVSFFETLSDNLAIALDKLIAEEALQISEEKYRLLSEQGGIGIGLYSPEGRILYFNNRALANMGGKAQDFEGKALTEVFGEEAGGEYLKRIRRAIKTGKSQDYEDEIRTSSGEYWFLSNHTPLYNSKQEVVGVQVLAHDITDRKRTEVALRQANAYNRSLIEASLDPLVTIGPDGKITDVNKATQDIIGCKREELIGKDFSGYFTDPASAQTGYQEVFSRGFVRDYPLNIKNKDGQVIPVLYNATLYRDTDGNVTGVFAAARDISERLKAEEKLKKSSEELRDLTRHLEEIREKERAMLARDLHDDLGQKLTALNMDISWLKSRIGVQAKGVENKLNGMVQLLNSTIESTQKISYGLRPTILDDLGLFAAIERQLKEFTNSTGIISRLVRTHEDLKIDSRISLTVFRVIQEALTNVARHSNASSVTLKIRIITGLLELTVRDNGKGITEDQINNPRSFGLLGIKERARSCGGAVAIKGMQHKGTKIIVSIPLNDVK